jgi:enoyl-[acyl-carrier protein] reductase/trans-2-enoyl-CoA reductase (NAD+)
MDEEGRIRIDDWEMREDVQQEVAKLWEGVNSRNLRTISDLDGYKQDFFSLFGFGCPGIDYEQEVEIEKLIPSLKGVMR